MPKYEAKRHYVVTEVCTIEAENANQAKIIAMNYDGFWEEYEGDYLSTSYYDNSSNEFKVVTTPEITIEEVTDGQS
tara:strand:+ start:80 stop:307 length:228 start_codon:yes stop_codon:yes gene_type:complete